MSSSPICGILGGDTKDNFLMTHLNTYSSTAQTYWELALGHQERGEHEEAVRLYTRAIERAQGGEYGYDALIGRAFIKHRKVAGTPRIYYIYSLMKIRLMLIIMPSAL